MTDPQDALNHGMKRRSVIKAAAWTAPVVAAATAVPWAAASTPPVEATSVGATTTSPLVNNFGRIEVFGIAPNGDNGFFPDGQTFTVASTDLDFSQIVTSVTGGTFTSDGAGKWTITPASGSTDVKIIFKSGTAGTYTVTSNGPVTPGNTWNGSVVEPA